MYQIRYHMVFCVKYRRGLLILEERCEYLKQVLKEIGERYWLEIEEMEMETIFIYLSGLLLNMLHLELCRFLKVLVQEKCLSVFQNYENSYGVENFGVMEDILVQ